MQDLPTHRVMKPAAGAREHMAHPPKIISLTPHASLHLTRAALKTLAHLLGQRTEPIVSGRVDLKKVFFIFI